MINLLCRDFIAISRFLYHLRQGPLVLHPSQVFLRKKYVSNACSTKIFVSPNVWNIYTYAVVTGR